MHRASLVAAAAGLLLGTAAAQEGFKGKTKVVTDAEGRVQVTVPEYWEERPPEGNQVINVYARQGGGHVVMIVREAGQSDVDKQRDRYLEYDGGTYAGGEFQKCTEPYFGYRINDNAKNRVLLRGFVTDGADGLVVTITSRLSNYDKLYAEQNLAIMGSVKAGGAAATSRAEASGPPRRVFDRNGTVSVAAPEIWKPLTPEDEATLLELGLKGTRSGPVVTVVDEGSPTNANLVMISISNQWKKAYGNVKIQRLSSNPPTMLVKDRKAGWIDYIIAFATGSHGYTLRLSAREGGYESYKSTVDAMAESLVFSGGPYAPAKELPGDIHVDYKKEYVVHARAEEAAAAEKVAKMLADFERDWRGIGVGAVKKPPPLHVVLVDEAAFADESHGYGEAPAAYDRFLCAVVATVPPSDKEALATWRGRLYAALAEASLHRELAVPAPAWLLAGLTCCMDAAGRSGKKPDAPHPALAKIVETKTALDSQIPLAKIAAMSRGEILRAESPDNLAMAWGYTHLMLYGKTTLSSIYRKWTKALEKAKDEAPPFDLGSYDKAEEDLKKHAERNWEQ